MSKSSLKLHVFVTLTASVITFSVHLFPFNMSIPSEGKDKGPIPKLVTEGQRHHLNRLSPDLSHFRRSSIPFQGRTQRIQFNSMETQFASAKPGPHNPSVTVGHLASKPMKSILKKTNHPILIDDRPLSGTSLHPGSSSTFGKRRVSITEADGDLVFCAQVTDNAGTIFTIAERHIRGAIDMLTFPTVCKDDRIEPLGRIKALLVIIVEGLWSIQRLAQVKQTSQMEIVTKGVEEMNTLAKQLLKSVKSLHKFNESVYRRWSKLLKQKGNFKADSRKGKLQSTNWNQVSLYSDDVPENMTTYEDVMDISGTSTYLGSFVTHWAPGKLAFHPDTTTEAILFRTCPTHIQFELILELLFHAKDMIKYSDQQVILGIKDVKDPSLSEGYEKVKNRILDMEFDSFFDPLCALELRLALSDLVTRKGTVMQVSVQVLKFAKMVSGMTKDLTRFTRQLLHGVDGERRRQLRTVICCVPKYIEYEDLLVTLSPPIQASLDAPVPMSAKFHQIMALCYKNSKMIVEDETMDDEPSLIMKPIRGEGSMYPDYKSGWKNF